MSQMPVDNAPAPDDADGTNLKDGNLKLKDGTSSATVYVRSFVSTNGEVAGFGFGKSGTFYSGGLSWKYKAQGQSNLELTFKLEEGVASLSSSSINFSTVQSNQQTATLAPETVDDSFNVNFTSGNKHDPQIVVTPIGN